jgi:nicotinamidase-related amidase
MMTHLCVDATARAASDLGFKIIVAADACATRDLNYGDTTIPADMVHKSFLVALKSYGKVMKSEEIIALLAGEREK